MQGDSIPLPINVGAYVSTVANLGGFEGIDKLPTVEGRYAGDDSVTIYLEHMGTRATMSLPMRWYDLIYRVATDTVIEGRRAAGVTA